MSLNINQLLKEDRQFKPSAEFQEKARISDINEYEKLYELSIEQPEKFWGKIAENFDWFTPYTQVLDWSKAPVAQWFVGGKTNIAHNCLDRHVNSWRKNKVAIIWQGEKEEERQSFSYLDLQREVSRTASMLKNLGVCKGDRVVIYLPMVPELAFTVLACARIGAVHSVVFAGFSAPAIADRVNDAGARFVITADGGYRRGKDLPLKSVIDEALGNTPSVDKVLVLKRSGIEISMQGGRDLWWHDAIQEASEDCPAEAMDSEDPLFILYTSGSTGKPKGIMHTTAGYMAGTYLSSQYIFDLRDEDTYWCTADIGWITGHSYIIYGPLLNGATTVMYEGAPNHPEPDRFWKIIEQYKVNVFYTAPTAIRAFMKWGDQWVDKHDLSSLRLLGSVGEPINPEAWMWYRKKIGGQRCPIVDTWWQTETGSIMIAPLPGVTSTKPGSATRPFFGVDVAVVDEKGQEVPDGQGGLLVIQKPWPSMLRGVWGDEQKFKETYWSRFEQQGWYLAGDGAFKDDDGNFWILGRIDDVLNVSGHRLSTMEVESALVSHPEVVEAAVVGFPHEVKGEGIAAFVICVSDEPKDEDKDSLKSHVAKEIGAIARPDQIRFTKALPKTRSGKIMRRLLRDIASGRQVASDTSTLEDFSVLAKLQEDE